MAVAGRGRTDGSEIPERTVLGKWLKHQGAGPRRPRRPRLLPLPGGGGGGRLVWPCHAEQLPSLSKPTGPSVLSSDPRPTLPVPPVTLPALRSAFPPSRGTRVRRSRTLRSNTALEPRGPSADTSGTAARTASSFSSAGDLVKAVLRYLLLNKGILFSVWKAENFNCYFFPSSDGLMTDLFFWNLRNEVKIVKLMNVYIYTFINLMNIYNL